MTRFRAAPRQGHMDRLNRIYSYAIRTKDYAIRFRTDQPDYSFLPDQDYDWTYTVYGNVQEVLPDDMQEPLGKPVTTDTIYIKTQVFRLLRYYSPAPRNIARSDWATQNITHNMTSSLKQPYGVHSY